MAKFEVGDTVLVITETWTRIGTLKDIDDDSAVIPFLVATGRSKLWCREENINKLIIITKRNSDNENN